MICYYHYMNSIYRIITNVSNNIYGALNDRQFKLNIIFDHLYKHIGI